MVASQRRLERKLKDLNMTLDEERQTHTEQRDQVHTFTSYCMSVFDMGIYQHQTHIQSNFTLTLSCVAACSESESSKEAGGRRRDGAGEDRWTEEKGSERHGGTDGAQRRLADQSHSTGN